MDAKFALFEINVPDYLILRARATDSPAVEAGARSVIGPAFSGTLNFLITGLDPKNYFFDLYESVDGVTLSELIGTFTYDVQASRVTEAVRFYRVGSGINNAPADGDTTLTDDFLEGATITRFEHRGVGSLVENDGSGVDPEWNRTGNTLSLLGLDGEGNAAHFTGGDTYAVTVSFSVPVGPSQTTSPFFKDIKVITTSLTMDTSYRFCRTKLVSNSGTSLTVNFENIDDIPDGTWWWFTDIDGGQQKQTRLTFTGGGQVRYFAGPLAGILSEYWVGKGDTVWIMKEGDSFQLLIAGDSNQWVGRHSSEALIGFANTLIEDGALYSADDYPRFWYWLTHAFPSAAYYIVDDNLDNAGYTRPLDVNGNNFKAGLFIISTTKRKFRMPDTRGLSERSSKSYVDPFTDATRLYAYPGGVQLQKMPEHVHNGHGGGPIVGPAGNMLISMSNAGAQPHRFSGGGTDGLGGVPSATNDGGDGSWWTGPPRTVASADKTKISGTENIVTNFSVIYTRCV